MKKNIKTEKAPNVFKQINCTKENTKFIKSCFKITIQIMRILLNHMKG